MYIKLLKFYINLQHFQDAYFNTAMEIPFFPLLQLPCLDLNHVYFTKQQNYVKWKKRKKVSVVYT